MFEKNGYSGQSSRLPDWPIRGVVFRIPISPRIQSQHRNGSKCSVRDLGQSDLCKNLRKFGSLPCPFKQSLALAHIGKGKLESILLFSLLKQNKKSEIYLKPNSNDSFYFVYFLMNSHNASLNFEIFLHIKKICQLWFLTFKISYD